MRHTTMRLRPYLLLVPVALMIALSSARHEAPARAADGDAPPSFFGQEGHTRWGRAAQADEPPSAGTLVIVMQRNLFLPDFEVIPVGTTVIWRNAERDPTRAHDTYAEDGTWASPLLQPGESWSFTFTAEGFFQYYCSVHEQMQAQLLVVPPE